MMDNRNPRVTDRESSAHGWWVGTALLCTLLVAAVTGCSGNDSEQRGTPVCSDASANQGTRCGAADTIGAEPDTGTSDTRRSDTTPDTDQNTDSSRVEALVLEGPSDSQLPLGAGTCLQVEVLGEDGKPVDRQVALDHLSVDASAPIATGTHERCSGSSGLTDHRRNGIGYVSVIGREPGETLVNVSYDSPDGDGPTASLPLTVIGETLTVIGLHERALRPDATTEVGIQFDVPSGLQQFGYFVPADDLDLEVADTSVATVDQQQGAWVIEGKSTGSTELTGSYQTPRSETTELESANLQVVDETRELVGLNLEPEQPDPTGELWSRIPPDSCIDIRVYGRYTSENLQQDYRLPDREVEWDIQTPETLRVESSAPDGRICVDQQGGGAFRARTDQFESRLIQFAAVESGTIVDQTLERTESGPVEPTESDGTLRICPNLSFEVELDDGTTWDATAHPATYYKLQDNLGSAGWPLQGPIYPEDSENPAGQPCYEVTDRFRDSDLTINLRASFGDSAYADTVSFTLPK